MSDDLVRKLRSQIGDDVREIYSHEALFRLAAARIEELEKERDELRRTMVPISDDGQAVFIDGSGLVSLDYGDKRLARADRLAALLREAKEGVRKARLSLSRAARDFHAQQAEDLLFYVASRLEARDDKGDGQ